MLMFFDSWTQGGPLPWVSLCVVSLCVGSFLNLLSLRLPPLLEHRWRSDCAGAGLGRYDGASPPGIVYGRSHCPRCGVTLGVWELIPLLSFVLLRRRCAHCGGAISWRYPAVELLTLMLSLLVVWQLGWSLQALAALVLTWGLVALALIDVDCMLLPDSMTLPILWCGLALNAFGIFSTASSAIGGAVAGYLCLYLLHHAYKLATGREGMGYGDFKLAAMLGAWLGWQQIASMLLFAATAGAVIGLALIALHKANARTPLPFGPWLAVSGWVHLLWM